MVADICMDGERIIAFGQDVKACAVGQASAAILGSHIVGSTRAAVATARDDLSAYLKGVREDLGDWPEVTRIASVRDYPGRHAAALLPYDAALAAIDQTVSASRNAATSDS
ncbi:iron-sulfur cluster assembly scaffold protein [Sphingomonas antarctica]|uniref:iron-sulfur cluster assembly scaffold protein n=1 Tax=Sphingomonas antarctica TaxID=2040274 RepID=UPI0039E79F9D